MPSPWLTCPICREGTRPSAGTASWSLVCAPLPQHAVLVEHVARRHPEAIRVRLDLARLRRLRWPSQWVYRCACGEEGEQTFMAEHVMRMGADAVDHFTLHATGGNDGG